MTETDPLIGQLVAGRYRVMRPLGEGGMGQVYLAMHEAIEKPVALKVLREEYSRKEDIVTRFQQEAISASRIKHPNVLDVFDFGRLDSGAAFLAMEFLEGNDVADELSKRGPFTAARAIRIALQVCRALAAAHNAGVVHRDMKPDNVFLQRTGDGEEIVKIVDFGIAQLRGPAEAVPEEPKRRRLTKTGMIFGTPEYMSPEQAGGKKTDLRVDVYAVGVILYELFTGAVPFTGETFMAVLAAHLNDPPPPLSQVKPDLALSAELQAVVLKALSKRPEDRFQNMNELAAAILVTPEGVAYQGSHDRVSRFAPLSSHPPAPLVGAIQPILAPGADTAAQFAGREQRLDTQLDAASSTVSTPSKTRPWLLFASIAFLVLAVGASWATIRRGEEKFPEPEALPAPTLPQTPEPTPAAAVKPVIAPAPIAGETRVTLSVDSVPTGAVLNKGEFQVCDATPCEVQVNLGETLTLLAKKGLAQGTAKVLAQKDQAVLIQLKGPAAARPQAPKPASSMCEVEVAGIKVLRPCQ